MDLFGCTRKEVYKARVHAAVYGMGVRPRDEVKWKRQRLSVVTVNFLTQCTVDQAYVYRPAHGAGKIAKDKVPQFLSLHTISHLWTLICKRRDTVNEQLKLPPLNLLLYGTFAKHSTAYRISHQICGAPWHKTPCAYIWVPFQLRRLLVAIGLDLPVMRVHGAGAYDTTISPACIRRSIPVFMVAFVSGVQYIRSERATFRPSPGSGVPVPFGSAQPSHGSEGCGLLTRWQSLAEARRQMDGARATTQMQLNEIQTTAHSEPELEFPCSESTAAADMPTAAAARTDAADASFTVDTATE